ncbi:response regulator [Thermodesulfobacterium sp. TA1]|uniref:ATP-binding response regulator n=1 Tax=Thermodesulfobacterium sp. TA1 TaxID=2234087 RepID=UPI00123218FE|nr:ATP-binding protein [Thermodesulfobacterium sp. TA1]QER42427.1 response regulator [Thermodesulfobacterium sp. TA1]
MLEVDKILERINIVECVQDLGLYVLALSQDKVVYLNKVAEEKLGYPKEEVLGKGISFLLFSSPELLSELKTNLLKKHKFKTMVKFLNQQGKIINLEAHFYKLDLDQEESIVLMIGKDTEELVEIKEKVENLYKNQSFTEFLRSLVHDFNNILQNTLKYLKSIEENIDKPEEVKRYKFLAEKTLKSWIDLNRLLIDYTKGIKDIVSSQVEMVSFLKNNLDIFQIIAGPKIQVQLSLGCLSKVFVPGEETFWRYIFLNFISNAKEAIKDEGTIEISLSLKTIDKRYLVIKIRDTGCGIPEENLEKIFQPFFTTKKESSGLGLFLVKNHIVSLGGKIEVESKVNLGTTFKVFVPVLSANLLTPSKKVETKRLRIILLEDEPEVRASLQEILEREGHQVWAFPNYEELEQKLDEVYSPDLLITDYYMPGIKGFEVYQILKQRFPELKVLFLTGDLLNLAELPNFNLLLKPFTAEELLSKLKEIML